MKPNQNDSQQSNLYQEPIQSQNPNQFQNTLQPRTENDSNTNQQQNRNAQRQNQNQNAQNQNQELTPEQQQQLEAQRNLLRQLTQGPTIIVVDRDELLAFLRRVYLLAVIFCIIIVIQWMIFCGTGDWSEPLETYGWIALLIGLIFLSILNCCGRTRHIFPLNWILVLLVVESIAIGIASINYTHDIAIIAYTVLIALAAMLILCVLAAFCPQMCLPGELCMCCVCIIFFIGMIVMITIMLVTNFSKYARIFMIIWMIFLVPIILYHAQIVHGRRFGIPLLEQLYCALMLTVDFAMLCIGCFYFFYINE